MLRLLIFGVFLAACGSSETYMGSPDITPPTCRLQSRAGQMYDTKLQTACEVGKFNGATRCLPIGMWEGVGSALATPSCDRFYDWSRNNATACLNGQSDFSISTWPHAGLPQTCGNLTGIIYQIRPTALTMQYDKDAGCVPFPFVLDLSVSRYSEYAPYPPVTLSEADFVDPLEEGNCRP